MLSGICAPGPRDGRKFQDVQPECKRSAVSTGSVCGMEQLDLTGWNAVALEVVKSLRPTPVYSISRLKESTPRKDQSGMNVSGKSAAKRRGKVQDVCQELSRYYELPEDSMHFTCCDIVKRGEHDRGHSSVTLSPLPTFPQYSAISRLYRNRLQRDLHGVMFRWPAIFEN